MGRDLLLGALYPVLLEVVDEVLVAPARATTRKVCPGGVPVFAETVEEDALCAVWPDL